MGISGVKLAMRALGSVGCARAVGRRQSSWLRPAGGTTSEKEQAETVGLSLESHAELQWALETRQTNEEVVLRSLRPKFDAGLSGFVGVVGCSLTIIMIAHLCHLVKTVKFVLVSCKENLLWLKTLPVVRFFSSPVCFGSL